MSSYEIANADCIPWMATLGDKSVDVTLCDPPYEAEAHTKGRRIAKRDHGVHNKYSADGRSVVEDPIPFAPISEIERIAAAVQIARVTKRWILVFCQVEAASKWAHVLADAGAPYVRTMVWVKPDAMPQLTGDRPGMGYESIVVAHRKGMKRWNGGGRVGVFTHSTRGDSASGYRTAAERGHPTQKPLALMSDLVRLFSDEGELVCDPYAGSASTGVAALRLGRRFIGCELDAKYHALALERLAAETEGHGLREHRAGQISMFGGGK